MHGLVVNSLKCLPTISHDLYYRAGQHITEAKAINYEEHLSQIYTMHKQAGLIIVDIHCDNKFYKVIDNFAAAQEFIINMNNANTKKYVPRAE